MSGLKILPACVGFAALLAATSVAHACSCAPMSRAKAIAVSDVVFQGRVVSVHSDGKWLYATLNVIRPIKGSVRTSVEIGTNASSAACGYGFREGQVVVVGASFRERQYRTNLCLMLAIGRK